MVAGTDNQNQRIINGTNLSGPATVVPHRAIDSNRKTGSHRLTSYEAHTVAAQVEGPRITGKSDTSSQVTPPSSKMVTGGKLNVLQGQPLHPLKHALQLFTDTSKEGWVADLNNHTARGTWFLPENKLHINSLELN